MNDRRSELLSGKLRGVGKSVWPNGTAGNVVIVPLRISPHPVSEPAGSSSGSVDFPTENSHPIDIGRAVLPLQLES